MGIECLGYVGYYSRKTVYDFPGLCSRRVVEFLKTHPDQRTLVGMWEALRPTYIVARDKEIAGAGAWLLRDYGTVRVFEVSPEQVAQLMRADQNMDLRFTVLKRKM